jgi:hypothetical protein
MGTVFGELWGPLLGELWGVMETADWGSMGTAECGSCWDCWLGSNSMETDITAGISDSPFNSGITANCQSTGCV